MEAVPQYDFRNMGIVARKIFLGKPMKSLTSCQEVFGASSPEIIVNQKKSVAPALS
jgi:hypothetical protein